MNNLIVVSYSYIRYNANSSRHTGKEALNNSVSRVEDGYKIDNLSGTNQKAVRQEGKAVAMGVEEDVISTIGREIAVLTRLSTSLQKFIGVLDRSAVLLLRELQGRGPLGISTLAADLQLDISTASRQTAALEAKGLVERLTDPEDGRVSLLQITPLGEAQLQEVRQIYHRLLNELFEGWSEEDIRNFEGYLSRYNRAMIQRKK